ncbi:hypothetical protein O7635_17225 [Asanoa sp. WMMD1127]|uniref:hypothetical protein n=1 Tax=Asanoa sp. WMMD1127 TaxID=3016107 RepID=UPI00241686A4|nr:hypothetical protein [Asanoa sp. WMMD1127]MDG4823598.1 hypothetical protein [Asanoa sp. WMMD1127]
MTYLTDDELNARLAAARAAAAQRRTERTRRRAAFAENRTLGLQIRHATRLARLDRELADMPEPLPPPRAAPIQATADEPGDLGQLRG